VLNEVLIALALIVATGAAFVLLRGGSSPRPLERKRQHKNRQQRRQQAKKEGSSETGSGETGSGEDERPGKDAISRWSDPE